MGTGRKLLLADDSITIQKVVNLTFADEGLEVTTVGNGDLAVEKIEEIVPDIVLADIHMPGLNGYEVCEFVKRDPRFRHIPVMLLVGSFEPYNEAEARRVGADDHLTKPFQSIRNLVSKVGALLSGKSTSDETPTKELDTRQDASHEIDARLQPEVSTADALQPDAGLVSDLAATDEVDHDAFADPSLDDAMIETTPVGDYNMDVTIGGAPRGTTPMNTADLELADVSRPQSPTIQVQDTLRMRTGGESNEHATKPTPSAIQPEYSTRTSKTDDMLLDLGDDDVEMSGRREDEFVLDIWDDSPAPTLPSNVPAIDHPVVDYNVDLMETLAPDAEVSNVDIIDVAPIVDVTPESEPESQAQNAEPLAAPSETAPYQGGMITLAQMSPEVIDAIARRAVEQLSEKVVEQIAWEVVPELAERLIKRRLEQERNQ